MYRCVCVGDIIRMCVAPLTLRGKRKKDVVLCELWYVRVLALASWDSPKVCDCVFHIDLYRYHDLVTEVTSVIALASWRPPDVVCDRESQKLL